MSIESINCPLEPSLPEGWSALIVHLEENPLSAAIHFDVIGSAAQGINATIEMLESQTSTCEKCQGDPSSIGCNLGKMLLDNAITVTRERDISRVISRTVIETGRGTPSSNDAARGWKTYKGMGHK